MNIKHSLVLCIPLIVDLNYWLRVNIISRFSRVVAKDDGIYGLVKKPLLACNVCHALCDTLSAVNRVQSSLLVIQTLWMCAPSLVCYIWNGEWFWTQQNDPPRPGPPLIFTSLPVSGVFLVSVKSEIFPSDGRWQMWLMLERMTRQYAIELCNLMIDSTVRNHESAGTVTMVMPPGQGWWQGDLKFRIPSFLKRLLL